MMLYAGDIVMGVTDMTQERRLVGHVALVPDLGEKMTFSMDLIKIIPKLTDNLFLYSAMYYGGLSKQISPLANGVNVLHLKPEAMMGIEMSCQAFAPFFAENTVLITQPTCRVRLSQLSVIGGTAMEIAVQFPLYHS